MAWGAFGDCSVDRLLMPSVDLVDRALCFGRARICGCVLCGYRAAVGAGSSSCNQYRVSARPSSEANIASGRLKMVGAAVAKGGYVVAGYGQEIGVSAAGRTSDRYHNDLAC